MKIICHSESSSHGSEMSGGKGEIAESSFGSRNLRLCLGDLDGECCVLSRFEVMFFITVLWLFEINDMNDGVDIRYVKILT
jgi:hypothetical protein